MFNRLRDFIGDKIKIDERTASNIAVDVICICVCVLMWAIGGWTLSAKIALTAICIAVGVGVWYLP